MDLCHTKNSQLAEGFQMYKGRIAQRDDTFKDETDLYALFAEQGASVSDISQGKVFDVVARVPGCRGKLRDVRRCFPQARLNDALRLSICDKDVPAWLPLPKHRWPKGWFGKYTCSVVGQVKNL